MGGNISCVYFHPGWRQRGQLQGRHASGARMHSRGPAPGRCRPSLILAEILKSFGQMEPINGQPVHHAPLDHQAAQGLQGRHCGEKAI